jgi:hypothetical protein
MNVLFPKLNIIFRFPLESVLQAISLKRLKEILENVLKLPGQLLGIVMGLQTMRWKKSIGFRSKRRD